MHVKNRPPHPNPLPHNIAVIDDRVTRGGEGAESDDSYTIALTNQSHSTACLS